MLDEIEIIDLLDDNKFTKRENSSCEFIRLPKSQDKNTEEPLEMPVMNFGQEQVVNKIIDDNLDGEPAALQMAVMNFVETTPDKTKPAKTKAIINVAQAGLEKPLEMPEMIF